MRSRIRAYILDFFVVQCGSIWFGLNRSGLGLVCFWFCGWSVSFDTWYVSCYLHIFCVFSSRFGSLCVIPLGFVLMLCALLKTVGNISLFSCFAVAVALNLERVTTAEASATRQ